ncbi:hypothetical protein [Streptacidiphilus jiangxiensis]|uniref:Uncharacterized protein n=1 Tax=Streptacidiphilus jiangxiensis TaxID=235985 RepID=A0A1H7NXJ1_STRJI|nr:hypothetical protein [Streptacidiphilus jiangxiensis]SEL28106.1 hypothetical protein SAMN05414137_107115 [Streptacidiphilus jiangxiensis]
MDRTAFNAGLAELRPLRDEIAKLEKSLAKLVRDRDNRVRKLGAFADATAAAVAKAAGVSIGEVVALVPRLDPTPEHARARLRTSPAAPVPASDAGGPPEGAVVPTSPVTPAAQDTAAALPTATPEPAEPVEEAPAPANEEREAAAVDAGHEPTPPTVRGPGERIELPSVPDGPAGEAYTAVTENLFSQRPNFTQGSREMVFLDAATGVMAGRGGEVRLDLGARTAEEILDAVLTVAPGTERVYITAGAPWHADAERYPTLKQAVAAWLNTESQRWTVDTGRGRDRMAGHFVHARQPVGRYTRVGAERNAEHVEIRSVGEWFDPAGADPLLVREAFVCLWKALKVKWPDVVLMGSPSQTGKDLWARTIPLKGQWAGGYPVLSQELRGLFHATAGQGRTELILPPGIPAELPGLVEYDRTFAYARHTWRSPVGVPRRVTGAAFAKLTEAEQKKLLMSPAHLQVRVTVPDGWEHVGLLPAPISGDRNWEYPSAPGATFTTWAGGAEVHTALSNPFGPWRIEVLDALVFAEGDPIDKWSKWLKEAWASLSAGAQIHADACQRQALYLASRAVRSILLFGIGGFAQRPRLVTGTTSLDELHLVPEGAEILTHDERQVTWQRVSGFSRDPMAHPEWSASVWSGARAALLSMRMRPENVQVGALHVPAGQVVAFRTDAVYLTARHDWPYHGEPGDYLLKGHLAGPVPAPASEDELLALRDKGRAALAAAGGER